MAGALKPLVALVYSLEQQALVYSFKLSMIVDPHTIDL